MGGHSFRVMGAPDTRRSSEESQPGSKRVRFSGVEVREYARSLGDSPAADQGVPLGLDWEYRDVTSERNPITTERPSSNYSPQMVIPIDEFEKQGEEKRRAKLMEKVRLREQSMKYKTKQVVPKTLDGEEDSSERTLSEDEMRQLSAHWLKIQPLTVKQRERIILLHTNCSRADIAENERSLRKVRQQRRATIANAETGMDEWQVVFEFFKRRFRRYRSGISKEREQELLWENAKSYWIEAGSEASLPLTPRNSLRSSFSSISQY